jgi:co-chaperonin GroES (HSP10)
VIVKTNEAGSEYFPLKGMLFVEPDKKEAATDVGGIIVPNYADKLNIGTITKMDCVMPSYKVGDRVVVTKGGDVFQCNGKTVYIYKHDMIIATVKE